MHENGLFCIRTELTSRKKSINLVEKLFETIRLDCLIVKFACIDNSFYMLLWAHTKLWYLQIIASITDDSTGSTFLNKVFFYSFWSKIFYLENSDPLSTKVRFHCLQLTAYQVIVFLIPYDHLIIQ